MAIPKRILTALAKQKVKYAVLPHKTVFTGYDLAATLGRPLDRVAKTVLVRAGTREVLVTVPAMCRLDFKALAKALGAKRVSIASEDAVKRHKLTPGATSPFGSLHRLPTLFDRALTRLDAMVVRAGSLTDSLEVRVKDMLAMESPIVAAVTERVHAAHDTVKKVMEKSRRRSSKKGTARKRKPTPRNATKRVEKQR